MKPGDLITAWGYAYSALPRTERDITCRYIFFDENQLFFVIKCAQGFSLKDLYWCVLHSSGVILWIHEEDAKEERQKR